METEADLPDPPATTRNILAQIHPDSHSYRPFTSSSSSSLSSSSPPDFLRHVQAAFKRHRPLGMVQSTSIRPRRILVPQGEQSENSGCDGCLTVDTQKSQNVLSSKQANTVQDLIEPRKSVAAVVGETPEDSSIILPSSRGKITQSYDENLNPFELQKDQTNPVVDPKIDDVISSSCVVSQHMPVVDSQKKVQLSLGSNAITQRANERMATRMDNLSSHMSCLSLAEMEWDVSNRVEISTINDHDSQQRYFQNTGTSDIGLGSDGGISSLLAKRSALVQDQQHQFTSFLQSDVNHPMTQSSAVGSSCATTTSVRSTSAPMLNSSTYSCHITQRDLVHPSYPTVQCISETPMEVKDCDLSKEQQGCILKGSASLGDGPVNHSKDYSRIDGKSTKEKGFSGDVTDVQSQAPLTKDSSNLKLSKSEKPEKPVSGKGASTARRKSDPELFFKVNGKLYQKLGKIGSGGSSEVHKVISSECTIYALKKIKLKGRDCCTAYGFCQEIEYLNKLKGRNNIIQLIDYEVTDKNLLQEVMNGSMNIKEGRIKDDGYIYMVLEYGEIDLAHMLSQKWKEMDSSSWTIDENWLRFYWQLKPPNMTSASTDTHSGPPSTLLQILQAVKTIHEERIVHSDLKPANFLLVKGSLKLIDFGIAKAIMSDTTNIQRDSQVGTLSYMSPEAFMCNENDANGNTIKCGRPSDIWSLGCILYQMVYGRTPFAEYKTFWSKFKVITDRNHEIPYGPVSNPWLLDLMKKCLAWERNERWRIPQLLQHHFLVPPVPSKLSLSQDQSCKLLQLMAEAYGNDREASVLCSQLQQLLTDPIPPITSKLAESRDQHCLEGDWCLAVLICSGPSFL
ncbi:hypothetical protein HHK36_009037 [Tetracentron sinense]|uniref:Protein kinase domain-containing protein n=1 Tax=Tetracentron sinense TaxID=13715 RepID=A0A834ZCC5_TETSI|nr:hypothetical protein HHK36_009037 [Tetracentron sinense]